ncbi:uncharacterized protein CMU_030060 [Cryptosporidium muris RN66]|uniref:Uncharacterized protein n=1 Tax=Cryptosporidium muris (strain RN66) TaxID=441375 RepID=B6AI89_CRYMR|nr:uncharacterized protein CMU_030060 [Cryptosporidium muris RN66]EEA07930.1 hypothetical protein, conserved [Cryptosporidium muris RN66]|eukprot:XP_002142279.1 hypothetical protein [Cryptosporidium muris RN66]
MKCQSIPGNTNNRIEPSIYRGPEFCKRLLDLPILFSNALAALNSLNKYIDKEWNFLNEAHNDLFNNLLYLTERISNKIQKEQKLIIDDKHSLSNHINYPIEIQSNPVSSYNSILYSERPNQSKEESIRSIDNHILEIKNNKDINQETISGLEYIHNQNLNKVTYPGHTIMNMGESYDDNSYSQSTIKLQISNLNNSQNIHSEVINHSTDIQQIQNLLPEKEINNTEIIKKNYIESFEKYSKSKSDIELSFQKKTHILQELYTQLSAIIRSLEMFICVKPKLLQSNIKSLYVIKQTDIVDVEDIKKKVGIRGRPPGGRGRPLGSTKVNKKTKLLTNNKKSSNISK